MRIALVGTGVIGSGWAARLLAYGHEVVAWDPAPDAERALRAAVDHAWWALRATGVTTEPGTGTLRFAPTLEAAVADAAFVQESAPERAPLKRELLARVAAACPPDTPIASSSSGLLPSGLQDACVGPERILIGHPFNPVYLLPLVEVVPGRATAAATVETASAVYRSVGMRVLVVRREIEGYLADRLQEALWREALHLVNEGVATTEEIDAAVCYGPGLRWAFMGTCLAFHIAGGDRGMTHMLDQFGPALKLPWTRLEAPELTDELRRRLVEQTARQADGRPVRELERWRDRRLLAVMRALAEADKADQAEARGGVPATEVAAWRDPVNASRTAAAAVDQGELS